MRQSGFLFIAVFFAAAMAHAGEESPRFSHAPWDAVLQEYVTETGVDYAGLQQDRQQLDEYLEQTGGVSRGVFDAWNKNEQLAFLINVYNAETLQLIIDHYPVDSIKDLGGWFSGPWDKKVVRLFGEDASLNHLEHTVIRGGYPEPRIHFALVCAAKSCPPLRREAFTGPQLDAQLTSQAETFLRNPSKNYLDKEAGVLYLSAIFKWYRKDFVPPADDLAEYVRPFLPPGDSAWLDAREVQVRFLDYDWSLNGHTPR